MNDIREEKWHAWDIVIEDFVDGNDVNLADVKRITIGFGDGNGRGDGIVYFDDVRLCLEYPYKKQVERVVYDSPYHIMEQRWHVWNIDLSELTDVNAGNIKRITIGFGDGNNPYPNEGTGTVYFDDIMLGNGKFPEPQDPYDESPIFLKSNPFVNGTIGYPYFLKQNCPLIEAGYGYIDEYPELIGKTTSDNNSPDSGILDVGYHYPNWYYVNAGDGNMLNADLDGDTIVNFEDFAILADGWQVEYDINDLAAMAEEWLQVAEPNLQIQFYGDSNDGYIEVGVEGFIGDTQRVFLLADGKYVRNIFGFRGGNTLMVDISKYSSGERQLKLVSVDSDRHITCSNITNIDFSCHWNYCLLPGIYEPNKPVYFYGYYFGGDNISVKAFEYGEENPIWSEVYSGEDLSGFIPAGITATNDIDYVEFKGTSTEMSVKKPTERVSRPSKNIRALLILPNFAVNNLTNDGIIKAVKDTFRSRGVPFHALGCLGSNYYNIFDYAEECDIQYIYYCGHGEANEINGVLRTRVEIDRGVLYSFKPSGVSGFDLYEAGFDNVKFAFFDCCFSGRLVYDGDDLVVGGEGFQPPSNIHNDISKALRMDSTGNHFFQGWWGERPTGMLNYKKLGLSVKNPYHYFNLYEWEKLKEGDSLDAAINYAISKMPDLIYGEDAMNNCRVRGQGNISAVKIE